MEFVFGHHIPIDPAVYPAWGYIDPDHKGECGLGDWLLGMSKLKVSLSYIQQRMLFKLMHAGHSGTVTREHFIEVMMGRFDNQ